MKKRALAILIAIFTLLSFGLTACTGELYDWIELDGEVSDSSDESDGESSEKGNAYTGDITNNITQNTVNITGSSSDVAYASASALRSAVSVYCVFSATVTGGYPWSPSTSTQEYYSSGSGVIYSLENNGSAFVITNFHVVYDADSDTSDGISEDIYLYLYGMESDEYAIKATYVGGSAMYDIAVLRVNASDVIKNALEGGSVAAVTVGDSDEVFPGQTSIAVGNPAGLGISVTKGIVSVSSEYITMTAPDNSGDADYRVIRIDAAINSGNSGGGLYNGKGELIGIVNAKISSSTVENIGYAIPSSVASAVAENIIDNCYGSEGASVMRAIVGIAITSNDVKTEYDTESGLIIKTESVNISSLTAGGLAEAAGLSVGDTVKSVKVGQRDEVTVLLSHHFIDEMLYARVGDVIVITYKDAESGQEQGVSITVTIECIKAY